MSNARIDVTKSPEWQFYDCELLSQVFLDMELIAAHGTGDFLASLTSLQCEVYEAFEHAKRDYGGLLFNPAAELARKCGFPKSAITVVVLWNQYREPLRRMAAAIRAEADRIRALKNRGAAT